MILIACINFVNLATAKAISRSKEIGMRKILGSTKKNIIAQFMSESFLLAFFALSLGLMLAQIAFPYFSELTNLNIGNNFTYTTDLILFITGLLVFITLTLATNRLQYFKYRVDSVCHDTVVRWADPSSKNV